MKGEQKQTEWDENRSEGKGREMKIFGERGETDFRGGTGEKIGGGGGGLSGKGKDLGGQRPQGQRGESQPGRGKEDLRGKGLRERGGKDLAKDLRDEEGEDLGGGKALGGKGGKGS